MLHSAGFQATLVSLGTKRQTRLLNALRNDPAYAVFYYLRGIFSGSIPFFVEPLARSMSHSHSKFFEIKPMLSAWQSSYRKSREEEVTLCRLRTGHTHATHSYLFLGAERPVCLGCGSSLSVKHILIECPRLAAERRRCFGVTLPTLISLLSDDSTYINSGALFTFIRKCDLPVIYRFR